MASIDGALIRTLQTKRLEQDALGRTPGLSLGQVGAIASAVTLVFLSFFYWVKFQGHITGFFRIGDVLPFSPYLDVDKALIAKGELGYDGQQFLSIAFDPLLQDPGTIAALDNPPYRYRRILYPLLGHLLALGHRAWIPAVMVAINAVCVPVMAIALAWSFRQSQAFDIAQASDTAQAKTEPSWHPLLLLCIPGIWITLAFSTADLLSSTLMVVAICCYRVRRLSGKWSSQRELWVGVAIAAACLTRETMLVAWFAMALDCLLKRDWKQLGALLVFVTLPLGWNGYVATLGLPTGDLGVGGIFDWPFAGILRKFGAIAAGGLNPKNVFEAYGFVLLLVAFGMAIALARYAPSKNRVIWFCACLYGLLFVISNDSILWYFVGYLRVYSDGFLFLLLVLGWGRSWQKWLPLLAGIVPTLAFVLFSS